MKQLTVLGSTGSIGVNTLDVVARHSDCFGITALTANRDVERLYEQCLQFRPRFAVMADEDSAEQLKTRLKTGEIEVLSGVAGLEFVAAHPDVDYVMAAIVGAAGLLPSLAAARAGKRILLANKESLVMSGAIFMDEVRKNRAELLPIDSEHNAIFQCMPHSFEAGHKPPGIKKILLTASGGPFRDKTTEELAHVTPEQACNHPNWDMGRKISVDSATLMNKGLEVIEACWLFDVNPDEIQVVVHRESVIHSMVEYDDGSVLAQLGNPDMRTPIAHALAWPDRITSGVNEFDICQYGQFNFESPDNDKFPCLGLAQQAIKRGGTAPAILNAANEVAVEAFLTGQIGFSEIPEAIDTALSGISVSDASTLEAVLDADKITREFADIHITQLKKNTG